MNRTATCSATSVARSVQIGAQYFNIGFLKTRLMISDRDQQIRVLFQTQQFRMLFQTQHVELTSHGCVRQEIASVKQNSHCYQNARGTRDHTCWNKKPYFSEYAMRHEIARVRTESHFFRVRSRTRDRTCQSRVALLRVRGETQRSHVSEHNSHCSRSTRITRLARVKDQRCETAICRQHDR